MATSVIGSDDLLRLVYGFGDVGHRERMTEIRKELHNEDYAMAQMTADFVGSDWCSPKQSDFILFLQECYTQQERNAMKQHLLRCKCCSRHAHYKDIAYKPANPAPESKTKNCNCDCRHYTRVFNRYNLA
jgi:hypothetical protein